MRKASLPSVLIQNSIIWTAAIGRRLGELLCLLVIWDLVMSRDPANRDLVIPCQNPGGHLNGRNCKALTRFLGCVVT